MTRSLLAAFVLFGWATITSAADWPAWRGPTGQGHSDEKGLPLTWSKDENVKWRVPLEHQGNSTPVLWGQKILLTQANEGGTVRSLLCLDRNDGKVLWQHDVEYAEKERNWNPNWYCNASPAVESERIYVSYASAGLYCYDFAGEVLWKRTDLGHWNHVYGNSASPVIYGDMIIQWCGPNEQKGRNWLLAVNKNTGETVWEHDEKGGSWSTPLLVKVNGRDQLILGVPNQLKGFDPQNGNELWFCDGLTKLVYTSALYDNGVAVAMSGYGGAALAVKLGGEGDITSQRLWHHPRNTQRVGSGVIIGEHVYMIEESGVPHCFELTTGEEVWKVESRPGGGTWGSILHAEGRLYLLTKQGDTHVFAASPKYELLASNRLNEATNSSIAVSEGELFIRTFKGLWCIKQLKPTEVKAAAE